MGSLRCPGLMGILSSHRLLVVTGKGGVGKSAIASALALASARSGQKTLVCEVNAKERVSHFLGQPEAGPGVKSLEPNLWAVNVRPQEAMREYALMRLKIEALYQAVFENRLVRYFLRFVPSLAELVMLGKILYHVREQHPDGTFRFDRVIIDAPATGHAVTFLNVAQTVLDTVPPGPMSSDARWMRDLLVDPQTTAAILVSLPEELPVNETLELAALLRRTVRVRPQVVVLNGAIPTRFSEEEIESLGPDGELADLLRSHWERSCLTQDSHQILAERLELPIQVVPRLFEAEFDRKAVEALTHHVAPLLERSR